MREVIAMVTCAFLMGSTLQSLCAQERPERQTVGALLETTIHVKALDSSQKNPAHIQPGSSVKLSVVVRNRGDVPSAPGKIFLRYALPKSLEGNKNGIIFETDTEGLPSMPPGAALTLNFKKVHQWPSIFEYIRRDWALREYQAVVDILGSEYITGTRAISFSAFYYEGHQGKKPVKVSSAFHEGKKFIQGRRVRNASGIISNSRL